MSIIFILGIIVACSVLPKTTYLGGFKERKLAFVPDFQDVPTQDLLERFKELKWKGIAPGDFSWLRQPEHLWSAYHALKKLGLEYVLPVELANQTLDYGGYKDTAWQGKSYLEMLVYLRQAYHRSEMGTDYAAEFWERRRQEGNATVVLAILIDVEKHFRQQPNLPANGAAINDTLCNLLQYSLALRKADSTLKPIICERYFLYLRSIGCEASAYNLLYERLETKDLKLNKKQLLSSLEYDTLSFEAYLQTKVLNPWLVPESDKGP